MRVERWVSVATVLYDRLPLGQPKTRKYAADMARGDVFPAIKCALCLDGLLEIRDGRHRLAASMLAGRLQILARFSLRPLKHLRKAQRFRSRAVPALAAQEGRLP